jgi:titin
LLTNFLNIVAWYDYDLVSYQKERYATDLEKTFEERNEQLKQRGGIDLNAEHLRPKNIKSDQPEWQQTVKGKKNQEYYDKLQELENEQITKEQRLRDHSRQYAASGDTAGKTSISKGMAHLYEKQL